MEFVYKFTLEIIEPSGKKLGTREIEVKAIEEKEAIQKAWLEAMESLTTQYSYRLIKN